MGFIIGSYFFCVGLFIIMLMMEIFGNLEWMFVFWYYVVIYIVCLGLVINLIFYVFRILEVNKVMVKFCCVNNVFFD